jgi:nucleoside-diphosphate-sugar epimerase
MRYFVTGTTGFIGGRVARQLRGAGHDVVTIARTPSRAADLRAIGVEVHPGDITDRESMRGPMSRTDGVFHIAAWYKIGARDLSPAYGINVEGTRTVLELMRDLEIPKGVYTSTLAVFSDTHGRVVDEHYTFAGPHISEYDRTKRLAHYEVALPMMREGLPLVIVQPGAVYGPGDTSQVHDTLHDLVRGRLLATPSRAAFCWGHVDDTARGHILAMERGVPGESYIIAGPPHTVVDFFAMAAHIAGKRPPLVHPTRAMMRMTAALVSPLARVVTLPSIYTPEGLRIISGCTYLGSNAKATRDLGFAVRPIEEGLVETMEWELDHARGKTSSLP